MRVKVKRLTSDAHKLVKGSPDSAGYDLISVESGVLKSGDTRAFRTGLAIEIEPGWEAQIRSRSGLALKHGIFVTNSPGTVDADYRGEIKVILTNINRNEYMVCIGDRIAQMVFKTVPATSIEYVTELGRTERGDGGFGSTGR